MKENETQGQRFHCVEDWKAALIRYAQSKGYQVEVVLDCIGKIMLPHYKIEPMPIFMQEWIECNPKPTMSRNELVHLLAERLAAVEAVLARKEAQP